MTDPKGFIIELQVGEDFRCEKSPIKFEALCGKLLFSLSFGQVKVHKFAL